MNWTNFALRLRGILLPQRADAEMEEEISNHLELQTRKHLNDGVTPEKAKELAQRDFGSLESAKEQCRDVRRVNWLANVVRDTQYAFRMFRRDPGFSVLAILMLALGIGANVATFSVMDAILLKMLPVKDPASLFRTVRVTGSGESSGVGSSYKVFQLMHEREGSFADLMAYQSANEETVTVNGAKEQRHVRQIISGNYFEVLGIQPAFGRIITSNDDREPGQHLVAVVSDRLWKKQFDRSPTVVGSKLRVGDQTFEIIGVAPRHFFGVEIGKFVDVWTPIAMAPPEYLQNDHFFWLQTIGRLHPGVSVAQAAAPMQAVMNEIMLEDVRQHAPPGTPKSVIDRFLAGMRIKGVAAGGGIAYLRQQYKRSLQLVMSLAAIVLLIACTNVTNLLLAKGNARQREIALRLSLGAGRKRILQQLITESILLVSISTVIGALIAYWATPIFVRMLTPSSDPAELAIGFDLRLFAFAGSVALATIVISVLIPAFNLARTDTFAALRSGTRLTRGNNRLRRILVAAQIALSLVLVVGATLFSRTLGNLLSSPLGFQPANVITARLTLPRLGDEKQMYPVAWGELLQRIQASPGIEKASITSATLFDGTPQFIGLRTNARQSAPVDPTATIIFTSAEYFGTLGIKFTDGHNFAERDSSLNAPAVAVINRAFARKFFGAENPIGRRLTKMADSPHWTEITGIVEDTKIASMRDVGPPIIYIPYGRITVWVPPQGHPGFAMTLQVQARSGTTSFNSELRRETGSQFRIIKVSEEQQLINDTLVRERLLATVAELFGILSLALAALGLYGVMNYAVVQRRQEIGIRMAIGAAPTKILSLMLKDSAAIILLGIVTGFVLSGFANRAARALLYGLTPYDPLAFATAAIVLLIATFIAALIPAYKASTTDPVMTLRNE